MNLLNSLNCYTRRNKNKIIIEEKGGPDANISAQNSDISD